MVPSAPDFGGGRWNPHFLPSSFLTRKASTRHHPLRFSTLIDAEHAPDPRRKKKKGGTGPPLFAYISQDARVGRTVCEVFRCDRSRELVGAVKTAFQVQDPLPLPSI